jgi:hypothetical protein
MGSWRAIYAMSKRDLEGSFNRFRGIVAETA